MTQDIDSIGIPHQERASTGIAGMDHIPGGGLPTQQLYLIEGTQGPASYRGTIPLLGGSRGAAHF